MDQKFDSRSVPLGPEYTVLISEWIDRFPYECHDTWLRRGFVSWSDIIEVAVLEQFRAQLRQMLGPFEESPVDIFLMAIGEPSRRDLTKVGGLPYRPKGLAWPETSDGHPMTFLAQFRFTESLDHMVSVPSDVLLVFISTPEPYDGECTAQFHFEWHPLGIDDLVTSHEAPPPMFPFVTCYGVRHRTTCITEPAVIEHVERYFLAQRPDICHARLIAEYLCLISATKIGGVPVRSGPTPDRFGRFICSLASIGVLHDVEYPWLNHKEPLSYRESSADTSKLDFGDCAMVSFLLDGQDEVRAFLEL